MGNYLDELDPGVLPDKSSFRGTLRSFATPGEYEPLSFAIYSQKGLKSVAVRATSLKSEKGEIPPPEVRWVKRYLRRRWYSSPPHDSVFVSRYLLTLREVDIPAQTFRQLWLTVYVPKGAPAGVYQGKVRVSPANAPSMTLPVEFQVLPFTLLSPPHKKYSLYYRGSYPDYTPEEEENIIRRELEDIRRHGASLLLWRPRIEYEKLNDRILPKYGNAVKYIRLLREYGFEPPYIVWAGLAHLARMLGHKLDTRRGRRWEELARDKRFYQIARKALEGLVELGEREGFGELVVTDMDEVFGGKRLPLFIELMKAVRQIEALRIYITFHNRPVPGIPEKIRQLDCYVDIRCYHGHSIDEWLAAGHSFEELRTELEKSGDEAWCYYNPRSIDVTPEWGRIVNGIWMWFSPVKVHCPWIYNSFRGDPLDDSDGHDYGYAFPVGDEIVPTRLWEAYREGIDDVRYFYTLTSLIEKRPQNDTETETAVNWLRSLKARFVERIKLNPQQSALVKAIAEKYRGEDYQRVRRECAEHIIRLLR